MKNGKRFIVLSLCLATLFCLTPCFASAASPTPVTITPYSEWQQLRSTSNSFDISDSGMASMTADTDGRSNSTKVTVAMYLERLQNGTWSTVSGMSWSNSTTNDLTITLSKTRAVASGYYYRLRSEHSASGPNGTEYDTVYSGTVYYGK